MCDIISQNEFLISKIQAFMAKFGHLIATANVRKTHVIEGGTPKLYSF